MTGVEVIVDHAAQILVAQSEVDRLAFSVGFGEVERGQLSLVVSELASNLIRHARGGKLTFRSIESGGRPGIEIGSEDAGPGITDPEKSLEDGYSTAGGLGIGLGTIHRMVDELLFSHAEAGGAQIVCRRFIRPGQDLLPRNGPEFGVATRARFLAPENGDAFVIKRWTGFALAGVIDGLGHGPEAQKAALLARHFVEEHFDWPIDQLFTGVDRTLRGSRGAVMAIALFDLKQQTLQIGSIGNIEVRLFGPEKGNFILRRGVLGLQAPKPVVSLCPWTNESILILHSDGLHSSWSLNDLPLELHRSPSDIALHLLRNRGKMDDDATVVVARGDDHAR